MTLSVSLNFDGDVEARVKAFSNGVGVPLNEFIERAVIFALRSRYPSNELPEGPVHPDQGLPGEQPEVDNELPEGERPVDPGYGVGAGLRPDNSLPGGGICPVFDPEVDNELPEGEVPPEVAEPK